MARIKYLSVEDILRIHDVIIFETTGSHGTRDIRILMSVVNTPRQKVFGKELHKTIFEKAAVYIRDIIMYHPFVDGNKRTGMLSGLVFLEDNGYVFSAKKGEIERFALRIIHKKLEHKDIATWLKKHSQKTKHK